MDDQEANQLVTFWRDAGPQRWFRKDEAFDRDFRDRFMQLHEAAARGEHDAWVETPGGALALVIALDQYPRNAFRGTARMFATDPKARVVADKAIALGYDEVVAEELRVFLYLPFEHSEELADQERSVRLHQRLDEHYRSYAELHYDVIKRFGRFPHRNAVLGRAMRPEEQDFLDAGGFSG